MNANRAKQGEQERRLKLGKKLQQAKGRMGSIGASRDRAMVHTTSGPVVGAVKAKGTMLRFQGIPYARAPIGERRWKMPEAPVPWTEPRQCTKDGPIAHQAAGGMSGFIKELAAGLGLDPIRRELLVRASTLPRKEREDCLSLNIRVPVGAQNLPVMVFIHGGDHTDGSGSDPFYATDALPERGCVLVTFNYRLGLMGFFAHPDLVEESPETISGNYGLGDQIFLLEWVQNNIAAFGGDADNVTIFGESAGGQAVLNLMTSPRSRGLFHRAIAQSPSDSGRWLHHDQPILDFVPAVEAGRQFADRVVGAESGQLGRLRSLSAEDLYEAYRANPDLGRYFYPVVDRVVLPETPMTALSNQRQAKVPLMIGYNSDECSLLAGMMNPAGAEFEAPADGPTSVGESERRAVFGRSYGSEALAEELFTAYPGLVEGDHQVTIEHGGDHMFGVHVEHASIQHALGGQPTYRYYFTAVPPSPKQTAGAFHAAELLNVFGVSMPLFDMGEGSAELSKTMGDHWVAFARSGDPNTPGQQPWPEFSPTDRAQMVFNRPNSKAGVAPKSKGLDVMRRRIDILSGLSKLGNGVREENPAPKTPGAKVSAG